MDSRCKLVNVFPSVTAKMAKLCCDGALVLIKKKQKAHCFRKSCKPGSDGKGEKWIEDAITNTLNTFENSDVRTTEIIVEVVNEK